MTRDQLKQARDTAGVMMIGIYRDLHASDFFKDCRDHEFVLLSKIHEMCCRQIDQEDRERTGIAKADLLDAAISLIEEYVAETPDTVPELRDILKQLHAYYEIGGGA